MIYHLLLMKRFTFYLLLFSFLLVGCRPSAPPVSISDKPISASGGVPQTNLPMPPSKPLGEMTWSDFDGKTQKLADLKGKAVVLDFWATYCPPCLDEIPHLNELQAKYGAENLQIVGLHAGDEEDLAKVPAFAERLKINYILATPEDELLRFIFADKSEIPQTAVFNRDGKLIRKFVGFDLKIKNDLDKAVEEALKR
ncbi:MAG: TlpA family protein disulfide reductase [Acidobacteriota bacterium]|nr:TlpA family protein disulfide reductase [Acidobacteriota bacterium]